MFRTPINSAQEAFDTHVTPGAPNECWEWQGHKFPSGYGRASFLGGHMTAHRMAYELFCGPIPEGLCVCHTCDNRACCNPVHLWLGTKADNSRDMVRKGRSRPPGLKGENNPNAKLSAADVARIRKLWAEGISQAALSRLFGVWPSAINHIIHDRHWT